MKYVQLFFIFLVTAITLRAQTIPYLQRQGTATQLIVEGKPFLMRGGELGNSSASSLAYMEPIWPKLEAMHLNTVLAPVYWDLIEPEEGKFDFSLVDGLLKDARAHDMKLVLLWFGTWKNSMSCYAPLWVKRDLKRFPRAKSAEGVSQEILTPFDDRNRDADVRAFQQLMRHLKEQDGQDHTVVMVQVENEIGMLPSARDHCAAATKAYRQPVPAELMRYLTQHKKELIPELQQHWQANGGKTSGTWEEVFGKSLATDELFMAWHYARYVEAVTAAGKAEYPLPMYLNAALPREGKQPGEYPSAGPLPHLLDVWRAGTPSIDFLSPDFYNPRFQYWNDLYTRSGNPLFIPEIRFETGDEAKAFYAVGHYDALGFSPFSIESTDHPAEEPLGKSYDVLDQLAPQILAKQGSDQLDGVLLDKDALEQQITMGGYVFTVKHDFTLGWSPGAQEEQWPLAGGLILQTGPDDFIVAGTGLVVTFAPVKGNDLIGIGRIDEGEYIDGKWTPGRNLNGDQSHQGRHLRIPVGDFGIQHLTLYRYR
ncbi:Beta-galactosidase GanA [Catalinimonas alkaloidigena]|uniref:Beta-galactosidase GanA n=1 Tax=Catalinimonas alkaloidigena TaxID=1075417 RepID=A0A1G9HC11_9BACT|nr:DUF5597 domain-containing protein [Catalinimonas alkaloidigena]SDL10447.1 Beta-galactosidase GanA [Catalinimonas alkaloidigena]